MGKEKVTPQECWDIEKNGKLLIQLVEAKDLAAKDRSGTSDPYVKVFYGKDNLVASSEVYKKTLSVKFSDKEVFFIVPNGRSELYFEVWDKDVLGSDFMGKFTVGKIELLKADHVTDRWYELKPRSDSDTVRGSLRLRLYWTVQPETRPPEPVSPSFFFYQPLRHRFKSGDLLAYDTHGLLPSLTKLTSGSPFAQIAMMVVLPNKWTQDEELYVVEITRNIDLTIDAFKENPSQGLCIFRGIERFHQVHCNNIVYLPLQTPLSEMQEEKLISYLADCHKRPELLSKQIGAVSPSAAVLAGLAAVDRHLPRHADTRELAMPAFAVTALNHIGRQVQVDPSRLMVGLTPKELIDTLTGNGTYLKPLLLRSTNSQPPPHAAREPPARGLSLKAVALGHYGSPADYSGNAPTKKHQPPKTQLTHHHQHEAQQQQPPHSDTVSAAAPAAASPQAAAASGRQQQQPPQATASLQPPVKVSRPLTSPRKATATTATVAAAPPPAAAAAASPAAKTATTSGPGIVPAVRPTVRAAAAAAADEHQQRHVQFGRAGPAEAAAVHHNEHHHQPPHTALKHPHGDEQHEAQPEEGGGGGFLSESDGYGDRPSLASERSLDSFAVDTADDSDTTVFSASWWCPGLSRTEAEAELKKVGTTHGKNVFLVRPSAVMPGGFTISLYRPQHDKIQHLLIAPGKGGFSIIDGEDLSHVFPSVTDLIAKSTELSGFTAVRSLPDVGDK